MKARRVDGDRLFGEHVLAAIDGRLQMQWSKVRRRGKQHEVDIRVDHLLVRVEPDEATLGRHVDAIADVLVFLQ